MTNHQSLSSHNQPEATSVSDAGRLHRRRFTGALAGLTGMGWLGHVSAQDSPPIEQRDPNDNGEPDDSIGPDSSSEEETPPEPTPSATSEDSDIILQEAEDGGSLYFALTGHNLETPFLSIWNATGEEAGPGLPLSEQRLIEADGTIRQDFQAMAFTYDPAQEGEAAIRTVDLPKKVLTAIAPSDARRNSDALQVDDVFADFWRTHGGADIFGPALSAAFTRSGTTTQVFKRAVFDKKGGDVSLRPVNVDLTAKAFPDDVAFAPAPPTLGQTTLVSASDGLRLREGPDEGATVIAVLPDNAEFIAAPNATGSWIPGYADGFSGWASKEFLVAPQSAPELATSEWRMDVWQGVTISETNLRDKADTSGKTVKTLELGDPVVVVGWVKGEEVAEKNNIWAKLEDGSFVYSRNIVRAAPIQPPPVPNDAPTEGRWIDVQITQQLMVAYNGREPVRTIVTTTGQPGWETPPGYFTINTRVANETMDSGAIGAESFYKLENVLFTQYFTDRGHALHFAWWKTRETIGRPGSHGCLNLLLDDARFFWDWADVGTPVYCRLK